MHGTNQGPSSDGAWTGQVESYELYQSRVYHTVEYDPFIKSQLASRN